MQNRPPSNYLINQSQRKNNTPLISRNLDVVCSNGDRPGSGMVKGGDKVKASTFSYSKEYSIQKPKKIQSKF